MKKGGFFRPALIRLFFLRCHAQESAALRAENLKVQTERLWISAASWPSQVPERLFRSSGDKAVHLWFDPRCIGHREVLV